MTRLLALVAGLTLAVGGCTTDLQLEENSTGFEPATTLAVAQASEVESAVSGVRLPPGFPSPFPIVPGSRLVNSFSSGATNAPTLGAAWVVEGTTDDVLGSIRNRAAPRWEISQTYSFLGSTVVTLLDAAGEFVSAQVTLLDLRDGSTQYGVTLFGEAMFSEASGLMSENAFGGGILEGVPIDLIPGGAEVLGASALPDGSLVAAHLKDMRDPADLVAYYEQAIPAIWPQSSISVEQSAGGETVVLFEAIGVSGSVTLRADADATDILILLEFER